MASDTSLDYLLEFTEIKNFPFIPMSLYVGSGSVIDTHQHLQCKDPPYWAHCWPGGQALARYTLEHPELVKGKIVLDIGPGTGVNSIAAALAGANRVHAVDVEEMSVDLTTLNCEMNGVANKVASAAEYQDPAWLSNYDVILMGDCFYDALAVQQISVIADAAYEQGVPFYTGDPNREHTPIRRMQYLEEYAVPDMTNLENRPTKTTYVFKVGRR